jgi:probable F420-dependent oxidoreductase
MTESGDTSSTGTVDLVRSRLGPVGVWSELVRSAPIAEQRSAVARIEALGYGSLWGGEGVGGKDAFVNAAVVLSSSTTLVAGTGIATLWARHPASMQGAAATVGAAWPGRFVLGVGVSHGSQVHTSGQVYEKPLQRMASYLEEMDAAAADAPATSVPVPRVLAALRPKMLELARDQADGAHPYFVPPEHIPYARQVLGPDKLLIPEQAVVLSSDPSEARRVARAHMEWYLRQANYVSNLKHLGYGDDDLAGGGSDRLVDAIVAWGDEAAIAQRVLQVREGGADHVLLQPLAEDASGVLSQLQALAPAVLR